MNRIALFTAAAVALSTAAYSTDASAQSRVVVRGEVPLPSASVNIQWNRDRYQGYENSRWRREFRGRWRPLATGYSSRTERQFIKIGGEGRFRKLRIEGVRGEPVILKVAVEFVDRTTQAVEYNDSFPRGTGEVIDLNGDTRRIHRIIVYTDPRSRGSYSVYGA
jgi:hypothetical protein